ncbi:MAG: O-succinylhomoserine sulfhydrylase [Gammaproteobacteria bacterium]|nr:O-succinylhomoserine sulfhydrylase [Gammaproteobacteria bacterium]
MKKKLPTDSDDLGLQTKAVRVAEECSQYRENSEALFLTSSFMQPDSATAASRFAGDESGYIYSRFSNPTVSSMEKRLSALEGSEDCIATSSGMSAILLTFMGLLKAGDHVLCSQSVFGATIRLLDQELRKFGIDATFVPLTDPEVWKKAIQPNTRLLFLESPSNPLTEIVDIKRLAKLAHDAGALLVVDNCFCTPILQRPLSLGADIVVHSATKHLDGQGRVIAGAICTDANKIENLFLPLMRCTGMTLSPFNAWVVLKGLETLPIRMREQSKQAHAIATWLTQQPEVAKVHYPGLPSHPQYVLAMQQQNGLGGAVLSFELVCANPADGRKKAFQCIDNTHWLSITANLGDVKTTITHPASTSHGRLTEEQRQLAGISQGLIRLSVGLEDVVDIQNELSLGFKSIKGL